MTAAPEIADIVAEKLPEIAALCRHFGVRRLDLFGSAVRGRFDPANSDLDFLVEFEEMPSTSNSKAFGGLREGLEELFNRQIDLLTEAGLKNPYLRRQVEFEKRAVYPRPR